MANQVTEEELEDLRQKFHLLEGDRKAYYEMSMHTMKSNKTLMAQLRDENKELRRGLAALQRESAASTRAGVNADEEEVHEMVKQVNKLRKEYDSCRSGSTRLNDELDKLKDQASELNLESQRPNEDDSPLTRKIRLLENRLDKAMIKYNEAQSIRKTYEQIVKRLKEERVGFDNQLGALERTLKAKHHDYEELLLLSGDANHANEVTMQELERVRHTYQEEKKGRERELKEKQELVQMKAAMAQRMENREKMRTDIIAKAAGDLGEEEEQNLVKSLAVNKLSQGRIQEERSENKRTVRRKHTQCGVLAVLSVWVFSTT